MGSTMSLARKCGACGDLINRPQCLRLSVEVIRTNHSDNQDALEGIEDEYCDPCVLDGSATRDLINALTKYKLKSAQETPTDGKEVTVPITSTSPESAATVRDDTAAAQVGPATRAPHEAVREEGAE